MQIIDDSNLSAAVAHLCAIEPKFASVVARHGEPPLWARKPGFPTLVHIILEQQVSLASAKACFDKLNARLPSLTPREFLKLGDEELLDLGYSRQKTRYTRILAQEVENGSLDLSGFSELPDEKVFKRLVSLKGIGPWTANIYLLMALGRPDIWPAGDLALVVALEKLFNLDYRPGEKLFNEYAKKWQPFRSVAARILWHHYLSS